MPRLRDAILLAPLERAVPVQPAPVRVAVQDRRANRPPLQTLRLWYGAADFATERNGNLAAAATAHRPCHQQDLAPGLAADPRACGAAEGPAVWCPAWHAGPGGRSHGRRKTAGADDQRRDQPRRLLPALPHC